MDTQILKKYKNSSVLITGGLGFIGSNLAIKLVECGAKVTIVDSMIQEYGGNLFNINPVKKKVNVNFCDITDVNAMEYIIREQEYIFHLAGQVCHIMSFTNPYRDIDYNITGSVILLEACRKYNKNVKIVYTGTRGQYGAAIKLPVNEEAPTNPKGIYEITNLTAEKIFKVYNDNHNIKSILTRLTNVYGPRSQMKSNKYGVANWFIRLGIDGQTIPLFGDGKIKRDFIYIDDVINTLMLLPLHDNCFGEIFNIGHNHISNFVELAKIIISICKSAKIEFTSFSEERKKQEPGDFYSDIRKIKKFIGWLPEISLYDGVLHTIEYYKKFKKYYW